LKKFNCRPLTKLMEEKLKKCHEFEGEICLSKELGASFPGLYKRKLVDIKPIKVNGKEMLSVYVTSLGLEYLNSMH